MHVCVCVGGGGGGVGCLMVADMCAFVQQAIPWMTMKGSLVSCELAGAGAAPWRETLIRTIAAAGRPPHLVRTLVKPANLVCMAVSHLLHHESARKAWAGDTETFALLLDVILAGAQDGAPKVGRLLLPSFLLSLSNALPLFMPVLITCTCMLHPCMLLSVAPFGPDIVLGKVLLNESLCLSYASSFALS
jgi:hypothetical protein